MSDAHSTPSRSASPDLAALALSLQEAAQALLSLSAESQATAKPFVRQNDGEIRSFYFSASIVQREKDLLLKHRAQDFQGLLEEVHTLLVGLVKVMRSVHKDVRVKGYVISSLGAQIDHASALVLRMLNVYEGVIPFQK